MPRLEKPQFIYDPKTLQEVPVDLRQLQVHIRDLENQLATTEDLSTKSNLLGEIGVNSRIAGELNHAEKSLLMSLEIIHEAKLGLKKEIQQKIRLAHVYQWKKEFTKSNILFEEIVQTCNSDHEAKTYLDFAYQHSGKNFFDQGRLEDANYCFRQALHLRWLNKASNDLVESSQKAQKEVRQRLSIPDFHIETERLVLRRWRFEDFELFAEMNASAQIMEYFPKTLSREETLLSLERIEKHFDSHGFGFAACELKSNGKFIGALGLAHVLDGPPMGPSIEVGWRLVPEVWGRGLAVEGAQACLDYAFTKLAQKEIVAFTAVQNLKSRRVMEKLGMAYDPTSDFDHPRVPADSFVRRHVIYRIQR